MALCVELTRSVLIPQVERDLPNFLGALAILLLNASPVQV